MDVDLVNFVVAVPRGGVVGPRLLGLGRATRFGFLGLMGLGRGNRKGLGALGCSFKFFFDFKATKRTSLVKSMGTLILSRELINCFEKHVRGAPTRGNLADGFRDFRISEILMWAMCLWTCSRFLY